MFYFTKYFCAYRFIYFVPKWNMICPGTTRNKTPKYIMYQIKKIKAEIFHVNRSSYNMVVSFLCGLVFQVEIFFNLTLTFNNII